MQFIRFENFEKFKNYVTDENNLDKKSLHYRIATTSDESFTGTKETLFTLEPIIQNWYKNFDIKRLLPSDKELKHISKDATERVKDYDNIIGYKASIGDYLKGKPNCMIKKVDQLVKKDSSDRRISLLYNVNCSAETTPQEMFDNGKDIIRLIKTLEFKGYEIALYIGYTNFIVKDGERFWQSCCFKAKNFNEQMSLKSFGFALIHPAFFRILCFAMFASNTSVTKYDITKSIIESYYSIVKEIPLRNVIMLNAMDVKKNRLNGKDIVDYYNHVIDLNKTI